MAEKQPESPRLEVYLKRSVLVPREGPEQEFREGSPDAAARQRLDTIRTAFENGYLSKVVEECRKPDFVTKVLSERITNLLTRLVDSVTSEVGRAIVGLTILQLTIKAIEPKQSIRLHKGGGRGESFSWVDGIPMRVLDKNFCTPVLRKYDLLRLNADGVFMTRSLAENYPYSNVYKAALRGARSEWLELVDLIEAGTLPPLDGLKHAIAMLFNRSDSFKKSADAAISAVKVLLERVDSLDASIRFIKGFVDSSTYSARLFEIAMHSLFQVLEELHAFGGYLKPLSQMRSANKKHGNIGDIEITARATGLEILESWDAKYGKPYLRDELDELSEKLREHTETELAGFVVDSSPNLKKEIVERQGEIEQIHDVTIKVLDFSTWANEQAARVTKDKPAIGRAWIMAFAESLCQMRRQKAPIDEPSDAWVIELLAYASAWKH